MYTAEMFLNNKLSFDKSIKGILTIEEAFQRAIRVGRLTVIVSSEDEIYFFTDDHCFSQGNLPDHYVPISSSFPMRVAPREGVEDGVISTFDQYKTVFHTGYNEKVIQTMDELLNRLNKTN